LNNNLPTMSSKDTRAIPLDTLTKSMAQRRWLGLNPVISGSIAALVLLLTTGAVLVNFHFTMSQQTESSMKNSLRRAAMGAAMAVDGNTHRLFTSPAQENTPEYLNAINRLEYVKQAMEGPEPFKYIYTCILRKDKVYFVLDPTPAGDKDQDGVEDKSHIMQEYPEASLELLTALRTGHCTMTANPQKDRWGTFLSAYAPVTDVTGATIAVVGVDYKDEPVATLALLDELGDPYAMVLVDREGRAGLDLGISGVPETFAVDAMGRITAKQSGPLLNDADIERLVASMQAPGRSPPSKNSR
jgi:hypothetical protein